jgi:outer membrane protein assembly factor BamB
MKNLIAHLLSLVLPVCCFAADWPSWRGPTGQGHCDEKNLPLKWSAAENVKWKVALAHPGNSTPIVWGEDVFLTQANKGGTVRSLLCLSVADGSVRWQKDVAYAEKEKNWNEEWYANASPTTDGERIVVSFGSAGMYCYDRGGRELWKRDDLGKWEDDFGNGSSPILYGDLAILWCGPNRTKGRNVLLSVDKKTGKTVWERDESFGSWSTPLVVNVNGKDQLILGQSRDVKSAPESKRGFLKGYDPKSGDELWKCQGLSSFVYTSALYGNGVAVSMSGYGGSALAVKLGGSGDVTKDRLWLHQTNNQRVGSGVIVGGHVYIVNENATPHCYDLQTGEDLWKKAPRIKGGLTWGSIVHADGRLYLLMRNGETVVMAANPKHEVLAVNSLGAGEQTNSSVVISNGRIYLRTFKRLWCIEVKSLGN